MQKLSVTSTAERLKCGGSPQAQSLVTTPPPSATSTMAANSLFDANQVETRSTSLTEVEPRERDEDVKGLDGEGGEKLEDGDVEKRGDAISGGPQNDDSPPDGGLAAWLVIFGVSGCFRVPCLWLDVRGS